MWVTNLLINAKEKKVFFRKQFGKFWASDNSDLQIKIVTAEQNHRLQQLYIYKKNYSFNANLLIGDN